MWSTDYRSHLLSIIKIIFINHPFITPLVILIINPKLISSASILLSRGHSDVWRETKLCRYKHFYYLSSLSWITFGGSFADSSGSMCLHLNATQTAFLTHQWVSWMGKFWRPFFDNIKQTYKWIIFLQKHWPFCLQHILQSPCIHK